MLLSPGQYTVRLKYTEPDNPSPGGGLAGVNNTQRNHDIRRPPFGRQRTAMVRKWSKRTMRSVCIECSIFEICVNGIFDEASKDDWGLFSATISAPFIRNLYIGSHMTSASVGMLPAQSLLGRVQSPSPHRFHFVFLDGCNSGSSALVPSVFGFDNTESSSGVPEIGYYQGKPSSPRKRPSGGIAFLKSFTIFVPTPDDPVYSGVIPADAAQFYIDFQGNWTLQNMDLRTALTRARNDALARGTQLTEPPWAADRATLIGYWYLTHNEYNNISDTW